MEPVMIYPPKKNVWLTCAAGIIASLACLFLIYMGVVLGWEHYVLGAATPLVAIFVGTIGLIYFSYLTIEIVVLHIRKRPLLVVSNEGIEIGSSLLSPNGIIPYEAIRKVAIQTPLGTRLISFTLHEESQVLKNMPLFKRFLLKGKKVFGKSELVTVTLDGKNRKEYEEVVKRINKHRRDKGFKS